MLALWTLEALLVHVCEAMHKACCRPNCFPSTLNIDSMGRAALQTCLLAVLVVPVGQLLAACHHDLLLDMISPAKPGSVDRWGSFVRPGPLLS